MTIRCARCGASSSLASEYCRRCGQSLAMATTIIPSSGAVERALLATVAAVPPAVWRGAAALAAGTLVEVLRRAVSRRLRPGKLAPLGEGRSGFDRGVIPHVAGRGDVDVTEIIIYRRFSRRR